MDFFDAMQEMKDGNKVRIVGWPKDQFIGLCEESVKVFGEDRKKYQVIDNHELKLNPCVSFTTLLSGEWELYKEENVDLVESLTKLLKKK